MYVGKVVGNILIFTRGTSAHTHIGYFIEDVLVMYSDDVPV